MSDNLKIKQPADMTKVNISQEWEVDFWCKKFGITKDKLKQAVAAAGPMVKDIVKWLGR